MRKNSPPRRITSDPCNQDPGGFSCDQIKKGTAMDATMYTIQTHEQRPY